VVTTLVTLPGQRLFTLVTTLDALNALWADEP
jgi:hypothetical protein